MRLKLMTKQHQMMSNVHTVIVIDCYRHTQTYSQTYTQTDRQTYTYRDRQTDIHTYTDILTDTHRQTDINKTLPSAKRQTSGRSSKQRTTTQEVDQQYQG